MSQINEALKRAKAAQQNNPPPGGLRLRPAEPPAATWGTRLATLFMFVLVAALGLFLVLHLRQKIAARNRPPAESSTLTPANAAKTTPVTGTPAVASSRPAVSLHRPATATPMGATTSTDATPSAVTPLEVPAFKLQGILYSAHSPLAMIDGQTVKIGDKVGDEADGYRVTAIAERTVTVVNATQTNVLKLNR